MYINIYIHVIIYVYIHIYSHSGDLKTNIKDVFIHFLFGKINFNFI